MIGIGLLMALIGLLSLYLRWRRGLYEKRWFHRIVLSMGPSGFAAVIAGWITTEVGRQPYTIYGLLRTADSISPIDAPGVASSLAAFVLVYFLVFGFGTFFILRLMGKTPTLSEPDPESGQPIRTAGITPAPAMKRNEVLRAGATGDS